MTLGACADGVTLSYEEMCRLQDLCESFSARLQAMASVDIHTLSFVRFACRSLERVKTRVDYPLAAADDDDVVDEDVGEEQRQAVLDVYAEMQDRRAYWKKVALVSHLVVLSGLVRLNNVCSVGRESHWTLSGGACRVDASRVPGRQRGHRRY